MDYSSLAAASKAAMEERRAALEEKQSLSLGTVLSPSRLLILTDPYTSKQGEHPGTGFLYFFLRLQHYYFTHFYAADPLYYTACHL
jgi:hypothetical protein